MRALRSLWATQTPAQRRMSTIAAVIATFVLGLAIRLFLSPDKGFEFDIGVDQGWGRSAVELGLARSYIEQVNNNMLPNYAPFSIIIFWLVALVQHFFFGFDADPVIYRVLIKLPAIAADMGSMFCVFLMIKRWKGLRAGLLAALVLALHPAILHETAVWGQTDAIFTMFLIIGAYLFILKKSFFAGMCFALALLTKMQAVFLMPLLLVLYVRGGWKMLLKGVAGGIIVTIPILTPFALGGTLQKVIDVYVGSVGYYSIIASAAYNFWWSMYSDAAGERQDTELLFNLISHRHLGFVIFGMCYAYAIGMLWKQLKPVKNDLKNFIPALCLASAFIAHSFFMWNTQMHERYLFPFVIFGIPMLFMKKSGAWIYVWISLLFYMNLAGWLHSTFIDRALFDQFPSFDVFLASLNVVIFFRFAYFVYEYSKMNPLIPSSGRASLASLAVSFVRRGFRMKEKRIATN